MKCKINQCADTAYKDGICYSHWQFFFNDMTNRQRMMAKRQLREYLKKEKKAALPPNPR